MWMVAAPVIWPFFKKFRQKLLKDDATTLAPTSIFLYLQQLCLLFVLVTIITRMHSSRMRTARSLTVSRRILCTPPHNHAWSPGNHAHPPGNHAHPQQPRTPPNNHTPPGNHACPPATTHTPSNHTCPLQQPCTLPSNHTCPPLATTHTPPETMHAPQQPRTPPGNHTSPATMPAPPPVDRILDTRFWKYYLGPNFVCGR